MPFARASELDRLLTCYGSAVLPRTDLRSIGARKAADWGTHVHAWMETGVVGSSALGEKIGLSGINREALWPAGGEFEVTLALNVVTREVAAARLSSKEARDEWTATFGDQWVTGTLDYVGELLDCPWVDDLKTGRFATWADHRYQQSFYALAWGLHKYGEPTEARSTITHWPRYPKHIAPVREGRHLSLDYFDRYAKQLAQLRENIVGRGEELVPGRHCQWCPSRAHCGKADYGF